LYEVSSGRQIAANIYCGI